MGTRMGSPATSQASPAHQDQVAMQSGGEQVSELPVSVTDPQRSVLHTLQKQSRPPVLGALEKNWHTKQISRNFQDFQTRGVR